MKKLKWIYILIIWKKKENIFRKQACFLQLNTLLYFFLSLITLTLALVLLIQEENQLPTKIIFHENLSNKLGLATFTAPRRSFPIAVVRIGSLWWPWRWNARFSREVISTFLSMACGGEQEKEENNWYSVLIAMGEGKKI